MLKTIHFIKIIIYNLSKIKVSIVIIINVFLYYKKTLITLSTFLKKNEYFFNK